MFVAAGTACSSDAAIPLRTGQENDVPFILLKDDIPVCVATLTPIAVLSGFTLPSEDGPADENVEITPLPSTAPTANTLSPSEGANICTHVLSVSYTHLHMTSIPFEAAISAALVTKAVLPLRSENL